MAWHEPLDLYYWFVNVFAGRPEIFYFISFIVIGGMCGKFRMTNITTTIVFVLFLVMMSTADSTMKGIFYIICILIGYFAFFGMSQLGKR